MLGFPYIFRGALDVRAKTINEEMKIAAAHAPRRARARGRSRRGGCRLSRGKAPASAASYIIPVPFDPRLITAIPIAVAKAAMASGGGAAADRRSRRTTPTSCRRGATRSPTLQLIIERVRRHPKRVVFAEGEEEQVIRAAVSFVNQSSARRSWSAAKTSSAESRQGDRPRSRPQGHRDHNARLSQRNAIYAEFLYERLQRKGFLFRDCQRMINQRSQLFRRLHGRARRCRRDRDRRHAQLFDRARTKSAASSTTSRAIGSSACRSSVARAPDLRRRHRGARDADRGGARGYRDRGGGVRAAPRLRAARRDARLLQLRPSARRALAAHAGSGADPRRSGSISSTTARWRPTSRSIRELMAAYPFCRL